MREPEASVEVDTATGIKRLSLSAELSASLAELAETEANRWIKALRAVPIEGRTLRDRFLYRGDSLWWFTELYFHKTRVVSDAFRWLFALEAIVERYRPTRIRATGGSGAVRLLANEVARVRNLGGGGDRKPGRRIGPLLDVIARGYAFNWRGRLAAARASRQAPAARARVAAFVHAAFWREQGEQYTGPVLHELASRLPAGQIALVGLGPRTSYRVRTWKHRMTEAGRASASDLPFIPVDEFAGLDRVHESHGVWRARTASFAALRRSASIRKAAVIHDCDLWPLLEPVFAGTVYLQFPWSAHIMDQIGAALDTIDPRVAMTYAEAGGWGRALVLEARRRGIATVGLQHGFIYRHWLNYLHEPDEMEPSPSNPRDAGFPVPTRTLVFDRFAAEHLVHAGRFPAHAVEITGSARLDTLSREATAAGPDIVARVRQSVGAEDGQVLMVVAAKYTQIQRVFRDLVSAAASIPDVLLVVKCHPAEGPEPYLRDAGGIGSVRIAEASVDLAALIRASRLLVTVNSTAALEAMVLGTPSLVLAMPNNLSPFVDAGVMAGVPDGLPIEPALRTVLFDERCRAGLASRAHSFMQEYRIGSDGLAASRAAGVVLDLAEATRARLGIS